MSKKFNVLRTELECPGFLLKIITLLVYKHYVVKI